MKMTSPTSMGETAELTTTMKKMNLPSTETTTTTTTGLDLDRDAPPPLNPRGLSSGNIKTKI